VPIRRTDVKSFNRRPPVWLTRNLPLKTIRAEAEAREAEAANFYARAAEQTQDPAVRALFLDLLRDEQAHEKYAAGLTSKIAGAPAGRAEIEAEGPRFILEYVQPGLAGLMDGSVSTLAPLFAAAFATQNNWKTFLVGLAASIGAGISMPGGFVRRRQPRAGASRCAARRAEPRRSCPRHRRIRRRRHCGGRGCPRQIRGRVPGRRRKPAWLAAAFGPVPRSEVISLAIGLPAPDPNALRKAAHDAADPKNAAFRKYLTPGQFAAAHGASPADYQAVVDWAKTHGLTVVATWPNRLLVDVSGTAEQIEQALFVGLKQRLRPDGSLFYAIDRDPSIDLAAKLLWISGLENRVVARPGQGSGGAGPPAGTFNSKDLRAAYAACTALTGAGQTVGLFELDDFTAGDITVYECGPGGAACTAGVPNGAVPNVTTTRLDKAPVGPTTIAGSFEAALDIEMAIGVAPGLAGVQVFEAPNNGNAAFHNDILASMATTLPLINQL
jgi:rubrerythrin